MLDRQGFRERVVRYRADPDLSREAAAARITAYVYGNILAFATLVPLTAEDVHHYHATLLLLGVAASTYLAHIFSDMIGNRVRDDEQPTRAHALHEMRNATPIITSAVVPAIVLALAALDRFTADHAILASEIYLFVRMALIGLLVQRLRAERPSGHNLIAGLLLAAAAGGIALVKVNLAH